MKSTGAEIQHDRSIDLRAIRDEDSPWSSVTSDSESGATVVTQGSSDLSRAPSPSFCNKISFPEVLKEILSDETNSHAITWLPNGRSFVIVDREKFSSQVLPRHFGGKATKYTSFTRKLSRWGFMRVQAESDKKAYYHKFFRREGAALHRMVQNRSNKVEETHKKIEKVKFRVLPLKKRPVSDSLVKTIMLSVSEMPDNTIDIRSCSELGSLLHASRPHAEVSSQQQVLNDAVVALLRGSSLYSSTSVNPMAMPQRAMDLHPHVLASAGLTYRR